MNRNLLLMFSWLAVILVAGFVLFFGLWVLSIWYRVVRSPRSEMFMCAKHGMMLPKDCIKFLGVESCPYCFHQNLDQAEKIGIAQYLKRNANEVAWKMLPGDSKDEN
jgi:hypothetical protein